MLPLVSLWFFFSANKINDAHFYVHRFTIEKNILYNITAEKYKKRTTFTSFYIFYKSVRNKLKYYLYELNKFHTVIEKYIELC